MKVVAVRGVLGAVVQSKYANETLKWFWYLVILGY